MSEISKFKTELSKLSGVDFHNPKFREVFKRFLPEDKGEDVKAEKAKEEDSIADTAVAEKATEVAKDVKKDQDDETLGKEANLEETDKDEEELKKDIDKDLETDKGVEETEQEKPVAEETNEEKALRDAIGEEKEDSVLDSQESNEETEIKSDAESVPAIDLNDQLVEKTLELELVRAGIREDRLDVAKRLLLPEIKAGAPVETIREKIAEFPEWIGKKGGVQGFGMPLGDKAQLTNEEKALKRLGVNPRD